MENRGLYIHIPFCKKKCDYCSFKSVPFSLELADAYIQALIKEITQKKDVLRNSNIISVYIGGGTPSVLASGQIVQIINEIKKYNDLNNVEFTIEVNPESVTREKLLIYKMMDINRISIGMQSSNDVVLSACGRIHTNEDFLFAIKLIKESKIKNLNIDCIIGLPKSNFELTKATVLQAIRLKPKHISCYGLTYEPRTRLYKQLTSNKIEPMAEDEMLSQMEMANKLLAKNWFNHYEISNFSKRGFESKHNLIYWNGGEYIGLGAGAVSFYDGERIECTGKIEDYCAGKFVYKTEKITHDMLRRERIMLGLRTTKGAELTLLKNKETFVEELVEHNLAKIKKGRLILNEDGFMVSNEIISKLF